MSDEELGNKTEDCSLVEQEFLNLHITKLELSFPVAFTLLAHNNPQQVMRLVETLVSPAQPVPYPSGCKSNSSFKKAFIYVAKCLGNIRIASKLISVKWGHRSIMESLMQCYHELEHARKKLAEQFKWKYVINLSGKELPLTTNYEIVSHFANLNGTSEAINVPSDHTTKRLRNKVYLIIVLIMKVPCTWVCPINLFNTYSLS